MSDWKKRLGVLYSTNPDYEYTTESEEELPTLSRKQRGGKEVTLITGFVGTTTDLEALGKTLRQRCGVGGSAKDGEIIIQGDQRPKLLTILHSLGYRQAK